MNFPVGELLSWARKHEHEEWTTLHGNKGIYASLHRPLHVVVFWDGHSHGLTAGIFGT
jgi:hypothetical protein